MDVTLGHTVETVLEKLILIIPKREIPVKNILEYSVATLILISPQRLRTLISPIVKIMLIIPYIGLHGSHGRENQYYSCIKKVAIFVIIDS